VGEALLMKAAQTFRLDGCLNPTVLLEAQETKTRTSVKSRALCGVVRDGKTGKKAGPPATLRYSEGLEKKQRPAESRAN
jgi:hypothetical protein